jgi:hypothetical protein
MTVLGRLLYRVRADAHRSPLAGSRFDAPGTIVVTSTAFPDGGPMPPSSAGKGAGFGKPTRAPACRRSRPH